MNVINKEVNVDQSKNLHTCKWIKLFNITIVENHKKYYLLPVNNLKYKTTFPKMHTIHGI